MGRPAKTWRVDFSHQLEAVAKAAPRIRSRDLQLHELRVDGHRYLAADADHLLSWDAEEDRARPGHPLG